MLPAAASIVVMGVAAAGCVLGGGDEQAVPGAAAVIDRSRQPLGTGAIQWVNGAYTRWVQIQ